jgi:hypothetical protein
MQKIKKNEKKCFFFNLFYLHRRWQPEQQQQQGDQIWSNFRRLCDCLL